MYIHIQQKIKKDNLKFKLFVSTENRSTWMPPSFVGVISAAVPIAIVKRLLHSPSKYTDWDQQIKTAAATGKATHCQ